jgi:hypothetical protein
MGRERKKTKRIKRIGYMKRVRALVGKLGLRRSVGVRVEIKLAVGSTRLLPAFGKLALKARGPDIGIPVEIAKGLGIWPPQNFTLEEVQTAGGKTMFTGC